MENETITNQSEDQIDLNQTVDPLSTPEALKRFAGYFELLDQIDRRLKKEDPEYRAKYYPDEVQEERK